MISGNKYTLIVCKIDGEPIPISSDGTCDIFRKSMNMFRVRLRNIDMEMNLALDTYIDGKPDDRVIITGDGSFTKLLNIRQTSRSIPYDAEEIEMRIRRQISGDEASRDDQDYDDVYEKLVIRLHPDDTPPSNGFEGLQL